MVEIILKKEGMVVDIEHLSKYPYLEEFRAILNTLIDFKDLGVEVNLFDGKLIDELLLDRRLDARKIKRNRDSFNNIYAIAIYYGGLNGNFLLEKYQDQKICYIQLQQTLEINMIRIAFHELHHFSDPFIPSEWLTILEDGSVFVKYEETVKAYVRIGLNEYCANLYTFSTCLDFLNKLSKKKNIDNSYIETRKEALLLKIPSYLSNLCNELNEFISMLRSENNKRIMDLKAELILFLWSRFFKSIYYFLGGWKAYKNRELDTSLIQKTWDTFITEIQNIELYDMVILLNSFRNLLLGNFESRNEMVNSIERIFLDYYSEKFKSDFNSLLTSINNFPK